MTATSCSRLPIAPWTSIASSTWVRRASARSGATRGSYADGAWVRPARRADSDSDSASLPSKVGLQSRLDPVGEVPVEDRVEVLREDLVLRPLALELHREAGLLQLPLDGLLARDVEGSHQLLRDGRAALDVCPACTSRPTARAMPSASSRCGGSSACPRSRPSRGHPGRPSRGHHPSIPLGRDRSEQRAVRRVDERVLTDAVGRSASRSHEEPSAKTAPPVLSAATTATSAARTSTRRTWRRRLRRRRGRRGAGTPSTA